MSSNKKGRLAFASALVLLLLSGVAASFTIARLFESGKWIVHTYEVQIGIGDVQSALANAARARISYLNSGDPANLGEYAEAKNQIRQKLLAAQSLIWDNPTQQRLFLQLDETVYRRIGLMDASIALRKSGPIEEEAQLRWSRENVVVAAEFMAVMQKMLDEQKLLDQRRAHSGGLFALTISILVAMFVLAVILLWIHYRLLGRELAERERMEVSARNLSARLLQLQDEERRKFSRELHDSLGQLLTMAKMHLVALREKNPQDELLSEIDKLLDESVTETRTISYLLHPPLLDEMGFGSAAKWYVEGFARRSNIEVSVDIVEDVSRLPRPMELVLFRVLQESLTNIHRHSKSSKAEVSLRAQRNEVILRIRDYGKGIPQETLENFRKTGTQVGVGLAGIRERIREQSGQFEIQSDNTGTTISVRMPILAAEEKAGPPMAAAASAD